MDMERLKYEAQQQILKTRLEVQEKTLTDVSREIHDNIGQILSLVKLNLHTMKPTETRMVSQVNGSIALVNNAINDLRNLSKILNADFISTQTLSFLLHREVDFINKTQAFSVTFTCEGEEIILQAEKQLILFRMAQECLQNAIKHSKASAIVIALKFSPEQCQLSIGDNGIGFLFEVTPSGTGFTNLKMRSSIIKASFNVHSQPGLGTLITITTPLQ
jgi:signal transduction histidine kinase